MSQDYYEICKSKPSGGKAGKGRNKTSSVQVRKNHCVVKVYRYTAGEGQSFRDAWNRAVGYVQLLKGTT